MGLLYLKRITKERTINGLDTIRKNTRKARRKREDSILAGKKTGLGFGALYPLLSGKRTEPTFSTMEKIADALDVSLDEFRSKRETE